MGKSRTPVFFVPFCSWGLMASSSSSSVSGALTRVGSPDSKSSSISCSLNFFEVFEIGDAAEEVLEGGPLVVGFSFVVLGVLGGFAAGFGQGSAFARESLEVDLVFERSNEGDCFEVVAVGGIA